KADSSPTKISFGRSLLGKRIKNKDELITKILYLILFVGLLIVIGRAEARCKSYTDEKLTDLTNENNELKDILDQINNELESAKRDIYDLWWATLSEEAFNKIKEWEEENPEFMACDKDVVSLDIRTSFFSYDAAHAKSFVWELKTGNVVYDRDGNVNCYTKEIMEENPKPIDCIELCKENVKETNEIL
ncbi:hypothetical protein KKE60_07610, partial [Patescibacteria group bacterium]|nr:hypothetical protein [Patescibacteria group bacterium]